MSRMGLGSAATLAAVAALGLAAGGAWAQGRPQETYHALLSEADHHGADGERLTTVAAIIRQDRENVHQLGIRDREDDFDDFFESPANRDRLAALMLSGHISRETNRAILKGHPLVEVKVYTGYVDVDLVDEGPHR